MNTLKSERDHAVKLWKETMEERKRIYDEQVNTKLIRMNFRADKFSRTLDSEKFRANYFRAARSNPDKTLKNDPKIGAFQEGNQNFQV